MMTILKPTTASISQLSGSELTIKTTKLPQTNKTKDAEIRKRFKLNVTRVEVTEASRTETDRWRTSREAMRGRKMKRDRLVKGGSGVVGVG